MKPFITEAAKPQTPFAATPLGIGVNTVLGIPKAYSDLFGATAEFGKKILQGTAATGSSAGVSTLEPFTGKQTFSPTDIDSVFGGHAGATIFKTLFGSDEPIQSISKRIQSWNTDLQASPFVQQHGLSRFTPLLAFGGVVGDTALTLSPVGGEEKALKTLVKETDPAAVVKILTKIGVKDELIPKFAEAFAEAKTLPEVKNLFKVMTSFHGLGETATSLKPLESTSQEALQTAKAESALRPTSEGLPRLNNLENPSGSTVAQGLHNFNLERLNISPEAKATINKTLESIKPALEEVKGAPLTNAEVIEAAKNSDILTKATSREAVLKSEAALLKTRQNMAALADGKDVSKEFIDNLRIISAEASRRGRELQSLAIGADPELNTIKTQVLKKLIDLGHSTDSIVEAAKNVDFTNAKEVTKFYRTFVKPTLGEVINEYRYINLLSSPKTHIVNAFSNLIQGGILSPLTKLTSGAIDFIGRGLLGKQREVYMKEVPVYYKGLFNGVGDAVSSFAKAMRGESIIARPDIKTLEHLPTNAKLLKPLQAIPRLLEASDVFFRTLIKSGEKEALAYKYARQGKNVAEAEITKRAEESASYYIFRKALDETNKSGQGHFLSAIDKLTTNIYRLRDVPGVKWFIPFVQTPMNILKQGIEYSPAGLVTLPGAANKTEQLAKSLIGSTVFAGAAALAFQGNATWAPPTGEKEKELFYASGRQPYSLKIGGQWVSYSRLGPLAYPIAMAAALQWYENENPKRVTQTELEKTSKVISGIAQFFSDQSYLQGLGDFVDAARGDTTAISKAISNVPSQLIPLSSLDRWVAQLIDPVYRKTSSKFTVDAIIQNLQSGLPFLSENLPAYTTPTGQPSVRQNLPLNAFSPLTTTPVNPRFEKGLQQYRSTQEKKALKSAPAGKGTKLQPFR